MKGTADSGILGNHETRRKRQTHSRGLEKECKPQKTSRKRAHRDRQSSCAQQDEIVSGRARRGEAASAGNYRLHNNEGEDVAGYDRESARSCGCDSGEGEGQSDLDLAPVSSCAKEALR